MAAAKRMKFSVQNVNDLISEMPDEILHSILSRLSIKEAARTSILSHRWKNLWKFISVLNFDAPETLKYMRRNFKNFDINEDERVKYANWVKQVLRSHCHASSVVTVEETRICFDLPNRYGFLIDHWLEFASLKKVQRLELETHALYKSRNGRRIDQEDIYKLSLQPSFLFKSLTSLKLKNVALADEHFEHLSSSSPFIESLSIQYTPGLRNLRIVGPSLKLKYLEVVFCPQLELVEISSAMYLVSFTCFGIGDEISLSFKNLPQLVEMTCSIPFPIHYMTSHCSSYLCQLKKLDLDLSEEHQSYFQAFSELPTLSNLRHLELSVYRWKVDADPNSIMYILKHSPFIQSFKLKFNYSYYNSTTKAPERKGPKVWKSSRPYLCLKVVEIDKFVGDIIDIDVAMHLIENARSLEKLIITPNLRVTSIPVKFWEREKRLTRESALQLGSKLPPGAELLIR